MPESPLRVRSMLFVPGDRPDMIAKLPRFAPDVAVLDLEDAVAAEAKDAARDLVVQALADLPSWPGIALVRINPPDSPWFAADLAAVAGSPAAGVVLPKTERRMHVTHVREAMRGRVLVAGLETALGVADARALLHDADAAFFGAEDFIADLGGRRTASGHEVAYARSQVVLAARLAGVVPIDQVFVNFGDADGFSREAAQAVDLGYHGKMCIHPSQVALAHAAFTPTDAEVAHARAVLAAGANGVGVLDGQMIDEVHVRIAGAVLRRAGVEA